MAGTIHHNKWHGFNHYTVPVDGYPDSATDPIASKEYPFRGVFYNNVPGVSGLVVSEVTLFNAGSGYTLTPSLSLQTIPNTGIFKQPKVTASVDPTTQTITAINLLDGGYFTWPGFMVLTPNPLDTIRVPAVLFTQFNLASSISDSLGWYSYSSLTKSNSSDWNKYGTTRDTVISLSSNWNLGYGSYTTLKSVSSVYNSVLTTSVSLSPETVYNGEGGTGWHIALSSITHRTDKPYQVDTRQKVATPVRIFPNQDDTLTWHTSAQTVYLTLTGVNPLTAINVIDPRRGGKYVMWVVVDRCPEEKTNLVFDKSTYNVSVKTLDGFYTPTNNVIALTASHITRIDFVYDGYKMLGKATRYRIFAPTEDDLYFQGTGLLLLDPQNSSNKSPVYVNTDEDKFLVPGFNIDPEFTVSPFISDAFQQGGGGIVITPFSNEFTSTSSFYVPGSGINFRFLNGDTQFFSFNLINAAFLSKNQLTLYRSMTSSFDRVIGTLSANGDWTLPAYAGNLIASPDESAITDRIILSAFPTKEYNGPWELTSSNTKPVRLCTSAYTIDIFSGKDRDISSLLINDARVQPTPKVLSGMYQPYNFKNERTATLTFEKIQQDFSIDVEFAPQVPLTVPGNVLWFNSMDDFMVNTTSTKLLTTWDNNSQYEFLPQAGFNAGYIGFTGSTGAFNNEHWIHDLRWESKFDSIGYDYFVGKSTLLSDTILSSTYVGVSSTRLTPAINGRRGAIYHNSPVFLKDRDGRLLDWSCSFTFSMGGGTRADGITFVIQSNSSFFDGGFGGGMGYQGIPFSVGVSFDTFNNGGGYDLSNNHVELNVNGVVTNRLAVNDNIVQLVGSTGTNALRYCWIDYVSEISSIFVYVSNTNVKPTTPAISRNINLFDYLTNPNNPESIFRLQQKSISFSPILSTNRALRFVQLSGNKFLESNFAVTSLSAQSSFFNSFTTFTVFETDNVFPLSSTIWWIGDFSYTNRVRGYGLALSGRQLYTVGNFNSYSDIKALSTDSTFLSANTRYVIVTRFDSNRPNRQLIYVNNRPTTYQRTFRSNTVTVPASSFFMTVGKTPEENSGYSNVKLYEFYLYDSYMDLPNIRRITNYLIQKYDEYKLV